MESRQKLLAVKVSDRINRFISRGHSAGFPITYVSEYPKSGGTWLATMLADTLDVPRPEKSIFPVGHKAVLHTHWVYHPKGQRYVYLHRDGRDVLVSSYFHIARRIASGEDLPKHLPKTYRGFFEIQDQDLSGVLTGFITAIFKRPLGNRQSWTQHIESWRPPNGRPGVVYASYEALLANTEAELSRIITELNGSPPEPWRVAMTREKYSMAKQTGRKEGQEDATHFIRKGVAGDWKNYFNRKAAAKFHEVAGQTLIQLGYEKNSDWVNDVPEELSKADS